MTEFRHLVAIVTGGASGIGAAVVRRLREDGASVAVLDLDVGDQPVSEAGGWNGALSGGDNDFLGRFNFSHLAILNVFDADAAVASE